MKQLAHIILAITPKYNKQRTQCTDYLPYTCMSDYAEIRRMKWADIWRCVMNEG